MVFSSPTACCAGTLPLLKSNTKAQMLQPPHYTSSCNCVNVFTSCMRQFVPAWQCCMRIHNFFPLSSFRHGFFLCYFKNNISDLLKCCGQRLLEQSCHGNSGHQAFHYLPLDRRKDVMNNYHPTLPPSLSMWFKTVGICGWINVWLEKKE